MEYGQAVSRGLELVDTKKILIALDVNNTDDALKLAELFDPKICRLKVGLELFTVEGSVVIEKLQKLGFEIFLDLKFHDIPNTVSRACSAAAAMGIWMMNVHALGGIEMMTAAKEAISKFKAQPILTAVTILTSHNQDDLSKTGITMSIEDCVGQLAENASQAGCDGVVCSAHEAKLLRTKMGAEFVLVTPGIRPAGSSHDDQNRIVTPQEAIQNGANYIVVGRPITNAENPDQVLSDIYNSIQST